MHFNKLLTGVIKLNDPDLENIVSTMISQLKDLCKIKDLIEEYCPSSSQKDKWGFFATHFVSDNEVLQNWPENYPHWIKVSLFILFV